MSLSSQFVGQDGMEHDHLMGMQELDSEIAFFEGSASPGKSGGSSPLSEPDSEKVVVHVQENDTPAVISSFIDDIHSNTGVDTSLSNSLPDGGKARRAYRCAVSSPIIHHVLS
jgi:hypothetical protein